MTPGVSLRPATAGDRGLLHEVYSSTREAELAPTGWTDDQKAAFVSQQFEAQDSHYRQHYVGATFDVILVDGLAAGRFYVARWSTEIRIIDIAVLPTFQGRGIGTALLAGILAEAAAAGKRVSIHVERSNRARRLYERLGFSVVSEAGDVYLLMEWCPPVELPATPQVNTAS